MWLLKTLEAKATKTKVMIKFFQVKRLYPK